MLHSRPLPAFVAMPFTPLSARALSVLRIVSGLPFLEHGTGRFLGFPDLGHVPPAGSLPWYGGLLELPGGLLLVLVLGLISRPVAFLLSGEMAVAYWVAYFPPSRFPAVTRRF